MFNLITTIIALLLMIASAIGGLYYLGESTADAQLRARLAQYYNYSEQIDSALLLYSVEKGGLPPGDGSQQIQELTDDGYLSETPTGGWYLKAVSNAPASPGQSATVSNASYRPLESVAICKQLNRVNGSDLSSLDPSYGGCPPCDDVSYHSYPACYDGTRPAAGG